MPSFVVGNQSGLSLGIAGRIPVPPVPTDVPQGKPYLLIKSDPLPVQAPPPPPPLPSAPAVQDNKPPVGPVSFTDQLINKAASAAGKTGIAAGIDAATAIGGSFIVPVKTLLSTRPFGIRKIVLGTPGGIALEQMVVSDAGDEDNVAVRPEVMEAKAAAYAEQKRLLLLAQTPPMWLADP